MFSWLPVVGDPLTLIGVMREPLGRFFLVVTLAKGGRDLVLALATLGVTACGKPEVTHRASGPRRAHGR